MDHWNVKAILELFFECSTIALKIKKEPHIVLKSDCTPVTDADRKIEGLLTERLVGEQKDVRIIGEETALSKSRAYLDAALTDTTWIIDPIDGTANYASGHAFWGISIGFAQSGIIREGGVYFPELGEIMLTDGPKVLYAKVHVPQNAAQIYSALHELTPPSPEFTPASMITLSQTLTRRGQVNLTNPVMAIGSCAYCGITLATGRDKIYVSSAKLWDFAGILPSLNRLGFYSGGLSKDGFDIVSCRISGDYYNLDYTALKAFALKEQVVLSKCPDAQRIMREHTTCGNQ